MAIAAEGRAAVALSTEAESARAAIEVGRQLVAELEGPADWAIVFAGPQHRAAATAIGGLLGEALDTPYLAGASAGGVIVGNREIDDAPLLAAMAVRSPRIRATPFLLEPDGVDRGLAAGTRLARRLAASRGSDDLLLIWADPFHVRPDRLLAGLDSVLAGASIVGGACSAARPGEPTFQFGAAGACEGGLAGLRLAGEVGHDFVVTQGCRALCEPLRVTGAHENLVLELDGRPAYEVVRERLPAEIAARADWSIARTCVGLLTDERSREFVVRNIVSHDAEAGLVAISEPVLEGMYLVVAERASAVAREDLRRRLEPLAARHRERPYLFGLYFNCMARGTALHGAPDIDAGLIAEALPGLPLLGMASAAEIGPLNGLNQVFTYTGVLVVVD